MPFQEVPPYCPQFVWTTSCRVVQGKQKCWGGLASSRLAGKRRTCPQDQRPGTVTRPRLSEVSTSGTHVCPGQQPTRGTGLPGWLCLSDHLQVAMCPREFSPGVPQHRKGSNPPWGWGSSGAHWT